MSRVVIKDQSSLEAVCLVLETLNVPYEKVCKKRNTYIFYKTPQEIAKEGIPFPIELDDKKLFYLMKMAHEKNITFNELCNQVLHEEIEKLDITKKTKKNNK